MHPLATLTVPKGKVAIHWFEQNSYAVKDSAGTTVVVDPYFPANRPAEHFVHTVSPHDESTLKVDYVLLTHDHGDHTCPESLARIHKSFPEARYVGPKEAARRIADSTPIPGKNVITIDAGETRKIGSMTVSAVYAKAPEGDPVRGIKPPDVTHLGYVVRADGIGLYFTGDLFNSFPERDDMIEAVARLKPDIGFLTNHPTEGEFPFFQGSAEMARKIGLRHAVPAHYRCFVKRDYDPRQWASHFPKDGATKPLIIPWNSHIVYPQD
jgi:L-ascorbate metabolism protein UlaG (beta-lactamase superfamily)